MKTHHLAFLLSLVLAGCARPPAIVPAAASGIDLAPVVLAEAEPAVREACERSIQLALVHHGFTMEPAGLHVEVEVSFWQDSGLGASGAQAGDQGMTSDQRTAGAIAPATQQTGYTADLTATLRLTPAPRTVLTSGTASYTQHLQDLRPTGGPSRSSACAIAAERFADALVEVVTHASR